MVTIKKSNPKLILLSLFVLAMCQISFAQTPDDINMGTLGNNDPLDGLVERSSRRILPYEHVREADIMWEKRIWRVIDIREKMNLPFGYPERPFFSILMDAT
ncbi:MAG: hypothetical protein ACI9JY_000382, partial [Saprospiraceae bacterium]